MGYRRQHNSKWYQGKPLRAVSRLLAAAVYNYPHRNLFIIGLPKSGTSWLNRMVAEVPGYQNWTPPYITWTDHTLKEETLLDPPLGYTVTKLHCRPTPAHIELFLKVRRPHVIIYRDLRDVAVSWFFYAHNVATADRVAHVKKMNKDEALSWWINNRLADYVAWVRGWKQGHDPALALMIRYEDLLADTFRVMKRVFDHYEVGLSDEKVKKIVDKHAFKSITGRSAGQEDPHSFNRKGVAGDWVNHFTPDIKQQFKNVAGEALQEFGCVTDDKW